MISVCFDRVEVNWMKFSAQEEYGLRCLIAIAERGSEGSTTIPEIAKREGLSQPHVAKLLAILRRAQIIRSTRGQLGGYTLSRHADQIMIGDVLAALGGRLYEGGFCDRHAGLPRVCVHDQACTLRPLWQRIQDAVNQVVDAITLEDVMQGRVSTQQRVTVRSSMNPDSPFLRKSQ
ncbi:MAG TPA: Rrf2 family transcriptional regulator [Fimbriimonadaceae bacterium]|nr:Rrf2 family transcriptional regulator [Fimbriimonadaceae bacterium]